MLKSLQIRNYVLIDSLDVTFPEGLVIITGQTGAGKSILLGALSLLLGDKADASSVAQGADSCVVEASFVLPESDSVLKEILVENELDADDGELIVRRVVNRSGRSRSFINDSPVNLPLLQSIVSRLVDIHSQHQTLLLSDSAFQMSMLDHYAGNSALLGRCASLYNGIRELRHELEEVQARLDRMAEEHDYHLSRYRRLEEANLKEGELEELEQEQKQLANAEEIKQELCTVESLFNSSDLSSDALPVASALKEIQRQLEKASRYLPQAAPLAERVASAKTELEDVVSEVMSINSRTELSAERLEFVEDRLSLLYDLLKKYSASTVAELIEQRDSLSGLLFDTQGIEDRKEELLKAIEAMSSEYEDVCNSLREARSSAALPFAEEVTRSIHGLELDHAVFEVEVCDGAPTARGRDTVRFLFSASGTDPVDVARCASGGEMSRLMLCLKDMMARFVKMPTLIFDEIDTGVSGSVAARIGEKICSMGRNMQVFAITHLPQVAAQGDAHYVVEKHFDEIERKATSTIRLLQGEDRVTEIARMLSGTTLSNAAIENAKEFLG
ncbi:MAG: DNA repair protein RecN [Candidatus Cryptobacteroides sp.]